MLRPPCMSLCGIAVVRTPIVSSPKPSVDDAATVNFHCQFFPLELQRGFNAETSEVGSFFTPYFVLYTQSMGLFIGQHTLNFPTSAFG